MTPAESPDSALPLRRLPALFVASGTALFAELLVIRWESCEIPVLAYFKNFPLLAVFIGLGAGCLLAGRRTSRWTASLWALAALSLVLAFAHRMQLDAIVFPEARLDIWSHEVAPGGGSDLVLLARNLGIIFGLLALNAASFVGLGQAIGGWLSAGAALPAYNADVAGSLAGVVAFAACAWWQTPPVVWLLTAVAGLALTAASVDRLRGSLLPLAAIVAIAVLRAGRADEPGALVRWSPYYRIQVMKSFATPPPNEVPLVYRVDVNRDYHQAMADIADRREWLYKLLPAPWTYWKEWRAQYGFPYLFKPAPRSVLIAGAGTGNNAAAALRFGAARVTAVEIDPLILDLGRRLHPSAPYASPLVRTVNDDARAFVRRCRDSFDLIEYGILDSHTALSALSSLRLENYVYTVEGLRDAVRLLAPDGLMVLSFHDGGRPWLGRRLERNIALATGATPAGTRLGNLSFFVFGPGMAPERIRAIMRAKGYPGRDTPDPAETLRPSTDDWPFLYANPAGQPLVYGLSLLMMVLLGGGLTWAILRGDPAGGGVRPDLQMFFLGAGFLLIETKALVELSLLFGSTWIVNSAVFGGIFALILLANAGVTLGADRHLKPVGALLALSLAGWFLFPHAWLNDLAFPVRIVLGTGLALLPVLFAGVIFSSCFAHRAAPETAFGFNLMGAMVGGALEAVSLVAGLRALSLLALALYACAFLAGFGPASWGRRTQGGRLAPGARLAGREKLRA